MGKLEQETKRVTEEEARTSIDVALHSRALLTSVFSPQSQHETQWKGFGPGHLCSVDQQAKEVGLVWQR